MMVPSADLSMSELTGLAPVDALSGLFIPGVMALYATMFAALLWADAQPTTQRVSESSKAPLAGK
jgi:hypothetical protein